MSCPGLASIASAESQFIDVVVRVVARSDDAVALAQALEHLDLARVLPAEPHVCAAGCSPVSGDQVDPATARSAGRSRLWRPIRLCDGEPKLSSTVSVWPRLSESGTASANTTSASNALCLDLGVDLLHFDGPGPAVQAQVARRADLDPADVVLVDAHAQLELVEQVDLADALAALDALAHLGVDGRQEARDRRAHFEALHDAAQQLHALFSRPIDVCACAICFALRMSSCRMRSAISARLSFRYLS